MSALLAPVAANSLANCYMCSNAVGMQKIDSRADCGYNDACETARYLQQAARLFSTLHDLRCLGKDEVGGSNPPSSSTKTRCPARDSGFLPFLEILLKDKKD